MVWGFISIQLHCVQLEFVCKIWNKKKHFEMKKMFKPGILHLKPGI